MKRVTEQELADARYALAMTILEASNAGEILMAMNGLTMAQAKRSAYKRKKGKKSESREWKRSADELYTVMMCAIYTKQDQTNE